MKMYLCLLKFYCAQIKMNVNIVLGPLLWIVFGYFVIYIFLNFPDLFKLNVNLLLKI